MSKALQKVDHHEVQLPLANQFPRSRRPWKSDTSVLSKYLMNKWTACKISIFFNSYKKMPRGATKKKQDGWSNSKYFYQPIVLSQHTSGPFPEFLGARCVSEFFGLWKCNTPYIYNPPSRLGSTIHRIHYFHTQTYKNSH